MSLERDKREILANSPFFNTFLNERLSHSPFWSDALRTASRPLKEKIKEKVGEKWEAVLVATLGGLAKTFEVFRDDLSPKAVAGMLGTLFLIGYEVGDIDNVGVFSSEIVKQMDSLEFLRPEFHHDDSYKEKLARFLFGSVYAGVLLRDALDPNPEKTSKQEVPEVFRDFIEGLDI